MTIKNKRKHKYKIRSLQEAYDFYYRTEQGIVITSKIYSSIYLPNDYQESKKVYI